MVLNEAIVTLPLDMCCIYIEHVENFYKFGYGGYNAIGKKFSWKITRGNPLNYAT